MLIHSLLPPPFPRCGLELVLPHCVVCTLAGPTGGTPGRFNLVAGPQELSSSAASGCPTGKTRVDGAVDIEAAVVEEMVPAEPPLAGTHASFLLQGLVQEK